MATIEVRADSTTIGTAAAAGAIAFGVTGLVVPSAITRPYGLPDTGPFRFLTRLWGTRSAALGVIALLAESEGARRKVAVVSAAMNGIDVVVAATAGRDLSVRTRVMAASTSATFAAASVAIAADLL